jgi:uncharacterized protein YprB with RNaseH-like and TPR domain
MDLASRLRAIVRDSKRPGEPPVDAGVAPGAAAPATADGGRRELTYEPDTGAYEATLDPERIGEILGGRSVSTKFGGCLVIDRRYEADRRHGSMPIGDCEVAGGTAGLKLLDPTLAALDAPRTVFIDLETTGISGGAGTLAFLVGCGYFDLGAFQVRQFLLTSYSAERALLAAVAEFFEGADLIVTYNGKTFDVPVMETRWSFHRMSMPLDGVPHFDMLHPARRLWSARTGQAPDDGGCRLSTLERVLFDVNRVGDVPGFEIPSRFFRFLRSGDPRPLEPVLEHNRLDLVSLAAVTARAVRLAQDGADGCRDAREALALGRVYERTGMVDAAEGCYRRASCADAVDVRGEALYRLGLRLRRARRFLEAADCWRALLELTEPARARRTQTMRALRNFAAEALAIHHEHRDRDLSAARELALFALEEAEEVGARAEPLRHRLARLERKIARSGKNRRTDTSGAQLFS